MAKRRQSRLPGLLRNVVRGIIRGGGSRRNQLDAASHQYPNVDRRVLGKVISEEQRRQQVVDDIMGRDKRRSVDLAKESGCPKGTTHVRISVTVVFIDPRTGEEKEVGEVVEIPANGRLATILNSVISGALERARNLGYQPPGITSANTSGSARYRVNYVECV